MFMSRFVWTGTDSSVYIFAQHMLQMRETPMYSREVLKVLKKKKKKEKLGEKADQEHEISVEVGLN